MGKIRVRDLAKKMGVPEQDLLFKLKSIGARLEGDDPQIDSDVIQAILTGKKLPQAPQREVIMRDKSTPEPPKRRVPLSRTPTAPLRPNRRRAVVQKADPKIKVLPATRPARRVDEPAAAPTKGDVAAQTRAPRPAAKVSAPPERTKKRAAPKPAAAPMEDESLQDFRGSVAELDQVEEATAEAVVDSNARRRRRAQRKMAHEQAQEEGRVLSTLAPTEVGTITISEGMRVRDLAEKVGVKSKDLIQALIKRGVMAGVNHALDPELAKELAEEMGFDAMIVSFEEEVQLQRELADDGKESGSEVRAPVVTVMGHVDHGKTTLLDAIRSTSVVDAEHGGITQHIAAYGVELPDHQRIVFLDTPGHEAFTQLRARGAQVTDIVVLVVAADDGVMPQTLEAIDHARAASVPIIVAVNKIDRDNANPDRVKKELADNNLLVEDWGGDTVSVELSALKNEGVDSLLEMIQLTADLKELKATPDIPAQGAVIEARKEQGRGIIATVLVQDGTLEVGNAFVCGSTWGRVRSMEDDRGTRCEIAGPSTPVEVSGFQDLPRAGDTFQVVEKESQARDIAKLRQEEQRQREMAPSAGRLSLDNLFSQIKEGETKELPVIIKADVQGSVEVLRDTLEKVSTDKVKVRVVGASAGAISTSDVVFASASGAIIYGFNVRPERKASELAEKEGVDIRTHTVIYELTDELKKAMTGLLEPTYREVEQGRAEVREIFKVPRIGTVAGCHVVEGLITRNASVRLLRDNIVIYEGKIGSLRRFKDDASEVRSGFDCGIGLERFQDVKPGDVIESFVEEAVAPTL